MYSILVKQVMRIKNLELSQCKTLSVHLGIFTLVECFKEMVKENERNTTFCHNIPSVLQFLQ